MKAKSLWHLSTSHSTLRDIQIAKPRQDECVIQTNFSMVSLGTERLVAGGGVPDDLHQVMRVPYMDGDFSFPISYGYSLSGLVIDGPDEYIGKRVHCLHPHQSYCLVKTKDLHVIPDEVPLDRAVLASNLETVVNALWDATPMVGQRILIVGYGLIGSLIHHLLQTLAGIHIEVSEVNQNRITIARKMGCRIKGDIQDKAGHYDLIFHCSASMEGLQTAIDCLNRNGKLIELSWYGNKSVNLHLGGAFHYGRGQIISSQVTQIATPALAQWTIERRKEFVFRLLKDASLDYFLGRAIPFNQAAEFFNNIRKSPPEDINYYFEYN